MFSESLGHEEPGAVRSDQKADSDPRLSKTSEDDGSRETHQEPAAHVGCLRRHGAYIRSERSTPEDVVLHAVPVLRPPEVDSDDDQGNEVDDEREQCHCVHSMYRGLARSNGHKTLTLASNSGKRR